jgi:hypothetical protein
MPKKQLTTAIPATLEDGALQVEVTLPLRPRRQESLKGRQPDQVSAASSPSRIPRITRLMALAIKFETMVGQGEVRDYADLARLGYVSRARVTQIMNLVLLAPTIQEEILAMKKLGGTKAEFSERHMRSLAKMPSWPQQQREWTKMKAEKA